MGQDDDARSLRRIVLRLLHEDEDEARRELDDIIRAVAEYIGRESSLYTWAVPVILTIPPSLMAASFLVTLFSKTAGNIVYGARSEEHTSELQSLMRISYAVFCLKKKIKTTTIYTKIYIHNKYIDYVQ